jgi:hypothetical protein
MARDLAYGERVRTELRVWSYLFMRVMYSSTMERHVLSPRNRALWRDLMVASRRVNSVWSRLKKKIVNRPAMTEENTIVCSQNYPDDVTFIIKLGRDQVLCRLSRLRTVALNQYLMETTAQTVSISTIKKRL